MNKKRVFTKLKSQNGESIVEVLVAVLITALASVLFAAMFTASTRIIQSGATKMNEYYESLSVDTDAATTAKIKFSDVSGQDLMVNGSSEKQVTVYQNNGKTASFYVGGSE